MSISRVDEYIMDLEETNAGLVERLRKVRQILALNEQPGGPWTSPDYALKSIREVLS